MRMRVPVPLSRTINLVPARWTLTVLLVASWSLSTRSTSSLSRIRIEEDGGYTNIVVKIADSVPEDNCPLYIQNIKELLREGSAVLHEGVGGRAYLKQVILVIPAHWRDARCRINTIPVPARGLPYKYADILVTGDPAVYGPSLHTQQSGGCGTRGERIFLPATFLSDWNNTRHTWNNPGRVFAKEWAKLRYGVYDEHGYPGDPLYPNYFKYQDRFLPTATADSQILGTWLHLNGSSGCDPSSPTTSPPCYFHPEGDNDHVSCSLGNLPALSRVRSWCSTSQLSRLPLPPTKHNILCSARPALDVILNSPDFATTPGTTRQPQLQQSLIPAVTIVRQPSPQYVLLIETSAAMADNWKWVRKAAQNLIRYEVPDNAWLAVVTFRGADDGARVEHRLVQLRTDSVRSRLADTIPDSPNRLGRSEEGCVSCGVQVAMDQVLRNREAGGHLVIIAKTAGNTTRGDDDDVSPTQAANIGQIVEEFGLRVSSVILRASSPTIPSGRRRRSFYETVASRSGGASYSVNLWKEEEGVEGGSLTPRQSLAIYSDLLESLRNLVALDTQDRSNLPLTIHSQLCHQEAVTGDLNVGAAANRPTVGTFTVDASLGRATEFGIYVEDDEDHHIKSVEFTEAGSAGEAGGSGGGGGGRIYGPYTKMSSTYDVVNFKTINFNDGEEPPFDEVEKRGKTWRYKIEWYPAAERRDNVVVVRSKPSEAGNSGLVTLQTWTNLEDTEIVTSSNLLAIFVKVSRGERPVVGARVQVSLSVSLNNGTRVNLAPFILLDNGFGEPDLVSGDGIYSRIITMYPGPGKYHYKVEADDNNNSAVSITSGPPLVTVPSGLVPPSGEVCCGSRLPLPPSRRLLLGSFHRQLVATPLVFSSVPTASQPDRIQPGKIGDLSLSVVAAATAAEAKSLDNHEDTVGPTSGPEAALLRATWTAPGGDFNDGSVMTYRFVFSQKLEELITPSVNAPALDGLKRSDAAGQTVGHDLSFKSYGQDYYVGLFAFDEAGNRGNMSNVVLINVPPPPDAVTSHPGSMEPILQQDTAGTNWTVIGAVIGALAALLILLLLVCLYCYFCRSCRRRPSRFSKSVFAGDLKATSASKGIKVRIPSPPESEQTDSSSYDLEINNSSSSSGGVGGKGGGGGQMEKQQQQLGLPKISSTSFGNNITPTYWSASQLLSEHEMRRKDNQEVEFRPDTGPGEEYPHGINYNPGNNYGYYPDQELDNYNYNHYSNQYNPPGQRYSSSSSVPDPGYQIYGLGQPTYGVLEAGGRMDYGVNKSNQNLIGNSDISSSTLGITSPSLFGSQMSLNSNATRQARNRNITQV